MTCLVRPAAELLKKKSKIFDESSPSTFWYSGLVRKPYDAKYVVDMVSKVVSIKEEVFFYLETYLVFQKSVYELSNDTSKMENPLIGQF